MYQLQSNVSTLNANPKTARSALINRNVTVAGHRTSVRLEPDMWSGLSEISRREQSSLHEICTSIAANKPENSSLTAAIRVYVMSYYRTATTEQGHAKAGHGHGILGAVDRSPEPRSQEPITPFSLNGQILQIAEQISGKRMAD